MQINKPLKISIIGSRGYPYVYSGYETLVKAIAERAIIEQFHERCRRALTSQRAAQESN